MPISAIEPDRGYMGDRSRGASMGRSDRNPIDTLKSAESTIRSVKGTMVFFQDIVDGKTERPDYLLTMENVKQLLASRTTELADAKALKKRCLVSLGHWQKPQMFYLQQVQRDSGGYDSGGAYWGSGGTLWRYESQDKMTAGFLWDDTRAAAKESIIADYAGAQFFS